MNLNQYPGTLLILRFHDRRSRTCFVLPVHMGCLCFYVPTCQHQQQPFDCSSQQLPYFVLSSCHFLTTSIVVVVVGVVIGSVTHNIDRITVHEEEVSTS